MTELFYIYDMEKGAAENEWKVTQIASEICEKIQTAFDCRCQIRKIVHHIPALQKARSQLLEKYSQNIQMVLKPSLKYSLNLKVKDIG